METIIVIICFHVQHVVLHFSNSTKLRMEMTKNSMKVKLPLPPDPTVFFVTSHNRFGIKARGALIPAFLVAQKHHVSSAKPEDAILVHPRFRFSSRGVLRLIKKR